MLLHRWNFDRCITRSSRIDQHPHSHDAQYERALLQILDFSCVSSPVPHAHYLALPRTDALKDMQGHTHKGVDSR
jgi:HD-like signal output (HDOD) protein